MVATTFWIFAILSSFYVGHAYILLTADLEDVHAIARQIASSPMAGQLNKIMRRASSLFNQQISGSKGHKRANENMNDSNGGTKVAESIENRGYQSDQADSRRKDSDISALGKNATYYLQSIKKIFENV